MKRLLFLFLLCAGATYAQGSFTATDCNQTSVNTLINGPAHVAVNGDVINIPACPGGVTWNSGITINGVCISIIGNGSPNNTPTTFGAGTVNTLLTDAINDNTTPLFKFINIPQATCSGNTAGTYEHISLLNIQPGPSVTAGFSPISFQGNCNSSGCPNIRMDNIIFTNWTNGGTGANGNNTAWSALFDNVFGVVDHCTISTAQGTLLANVNNSAWNGNPASPTTGYGDNSWTQADSQGSQSQLFFENENLVVGVADCDQTVPNGNRGGCRFTVRFSQFNNPGNSITFNHGTESGGRMRGARQIEVYGNNWTCTNSCPTAAVGYRSGTGKVFGNTLQKQVIGNTINNIVNFSVDRADHPFNTFLGCNGESPFDINDGASLAGPFTILTVSGTGITVSGTPFTNAAFNYGGANLFTVYNATKGFYSEISSNTTSAITTFRSVTCSGTGCTVPNPWAVGDTFYVTGTTNYSNGTVTTGGTNVFTDSGQAWTVNQWIPTGIPYSAIDITAGWATEFISNTATVATLHNNSGFAPANIATVGDIYAITRASLCLDQGARGAGSPIILGNPPTPVGPITQALDPTYEWDDPVPNVNFSIVQTDTLRLLANRDWYAETFGPGSHGENQTAQTSSTAPFNGTAGVGHGTTANRPVTCTTGTGYYATDVGNWNSSPNTLAGGIAQGQLYVCASTNTWVLNYTPFTYPHPLISLPLISVSPTSINFGNVTVSTSSSPVTVTVSNNTTSSITLNSTYYTITGTNAADFVNTGSITNPCQNNGVIAAGATCLAAITFTPGANGSRGPATFTVNSSVGSATTTLTGTGTQATLALCFTPTPCTTSFNFGNVNVGAVSSGQTVTLTNTGTATMTGLFQNQVLSDLANFQISSNACSTTLNASASCTFSVVCHPTIGGLINGTITMVTNASNSPTVANLNCTGVIIGVVPGVKIRNNPTVNGGITVQ